MRLTPLLFGLAVAFSLPALASEPGQPLDCSDWVFLERGYSCDEWLSFPCGSDEPWCMLPGGNGDRLLDANGNFLRVDVRYREGPGPCPNFVAVRWEILQFDGVTETTIGFIESRCNFPGVDGSDVVDLQGVSFDPTTGTLFLELLSYCSGTTCGAQIAQYNGRWVAAIRGFTTTFEILQTYTPTANELSFRVPAMPEGLPAADYFDTYYGAIGNYDFTEAQPLQCDYPATTPSVGDYLTVMDTLPAPAAGQGRWYLTAVTYQGEMRYGRKASGGVLSGRDPETLARCQE